MAVAADGSIQPYLAESITPNATYTEWTVTLRPGISFNDGSATHRPGGQEQLRRPPGLRSSPAPPSTR